MQSCIREAGAKQLFHRIGIIDAAIQGRNAGGIGVDGDKQGIKIRHGDWLSKMRLGVRNSIEHGKRGYDHCFCYGAEMMAEFAGSLLPIKNCCAVCGEYLKYGLRRKRSLRVTYFLNEKRCINERFRIAEAI